MQSQQQGHDDVSTPAATGCLAEGVGCRGVDFGVLRVFSRRLGRVLECLHV